MNLPNRITVLRVLLIPLCLLFIMLGLYVPGVIVFILAALTDWLDGYLARRDKLVTNFGKFADPVADKILVLSVMTALLARGHYPWWAVVIVLARELAVDGLRLVAAQQGIVIAAGLAGKLKTNVQFISIVCSMLFLPPALTLSLAVLMSALTIVSGWSYFRQSRHLLRYN